MTPSWKLFALLGVSLVPTSVYAQTTAVDTDETYPQSLANIAASLLSEYYPSTTPTNLAGISWPTDIVVGSSTIKIRPDTTTTPSATATPSTTANPSKATSGSGSTHSDASTGTSPTSGAAASTNNADSSSSPSPTSSADEKKPNKGMSHGTKTGIIVGVIFGTLALLAIIVLAFCFIRRRKGIDRSYRKRRSDASMLNNEQPGSWHEPGLENIPPPHSVYDSTNRYHHVPDHANPEMGMHPAYASHHNSQPYDSQNHPLQPYRDQGNHSHHHLPYQGIATENPFYSNEERADAQRMPNGLNSNGVNDGHFEPAATAPRRKSIPRRPVPSSNVTPPRGRLVPSGPMHGNGADDFVSPAVPMRSPERRNSPKIHYPTRDEVSQFDFMGRNEQLEQRSRSSPRTEPRRQSRPSQEPGWDYDAANNAWRRQSSVNTTVRMS